MWILKLKDILQNCKFITIPYRLRSYKLYSVFCRIYKPELLRFVWLLFVAFCVAICVC